MNEANGGEPLTNRRKNCESGPTGQHFMEAVICVCIKAWQPTTVQQHMAYQCADSALLQIQVQSVITNEDYMKAVASCLMCI